MCNIYQSVVILKSPITESEELICHTYVFHDILEQFGEIKHYNIFNLDGNQVWIEIQIFLSAHVLHCYKHFWETLLRRLENTYLAHDWEILGQEKKKTWFIVFSFIVHFIHLFWSVWSKRYEKPLFSFSFLGQEKETSAMQLLDVI